MWMVHVDYGLTQWKGVFRKSTFVESLANSQSKSLLRIRRHVLVLTSLLSVELYVQHPSSGSHLDSLFIMFKMMASLRRPSLSELAMMAQQVWCDAGL